MPSTLPERPGHAPRTPAGAGVATSTPRLRSDLLPAFALALAALVLYVASVQTRLTIDGAGLAGNALLGTGERFYNVLYLPLVRGVLGLHERLGGGPPDLTSVIHASALFASLGVACAYLFARALGALRPAALLAAAAWAVSPGLWFYATTVETHAVHAGVASAVLLAILLLPWRRAAVALATTTALVLLLFWTQQVSLLLGPGLVLLVDLARRRADPRQPSRAQGFTPLQLVLGVGPLLLAGFVLALGLANLWRFGTALPTVDGQVGQILSDRSPLPTWRTEWLSPLGLLGPLAFLGLLRGPERGRERLTLLALLLPPALFFSWWGVQERGGYFLGSGAVYVTLVAFGLGALLRGRGPVLQALAGLALLLPQAWLGHSALAQHDQGFDPQQRALQVQALLAADSEHPPGLLLATANTAPPLAIHAPEVEEFLLWEACKQALVLSDGESDPTHLVPWVLRRVERELAAGRRVALETCYRAADPNRDWRAYYPSLDAIRAALEQRFETIEHPHSSWTLLELREPSP